MDLEVPPKGFFIVIRLSPQKLTSKIDFKIIFQSYLSNDFGHVETKIGAKKRVVLLCGMSSLILR